MRELELLIQDHLVGGLKPEPITPINAPFMEECVGFKVGRMALESVHPFTNPFTPALEVTDDIEFVQNLNNLFIVGYGDIGISPAYVEVYMYNSYTSYILIETIDNNSHLFDLVHFGSFFILSDGYTMLYNDVELGTYLTAPMAMVPLCSAMCNFNGQLVGGCIRSDWYDCDERYIVWSDIGSINCIPDRSNVAGYRPDPYMGQVLDLKKFGGGVNVYSSEGISSLMPVVDPAPTFGLREVMDIGIHNKAAVDGSPTQQVFVDTNDDLWRIDGEGLAKLGYRSYLTSESYRVIYVKQANEFYITDYSDTYILSNGRLTKSPQALYEVWSDQRNIYGVANGPRNTYSTFVTCPFDMGYRGQKTIFTIEIASDGLDPIEVAIDWRMDSSESFTRTSYVRTNDQGVATLIISGVEFRFCIRSLYSSGISIQYVKVRYKMTDLRSIRGVYAPPPRGQYAD